MNVAQFLAGLLICSLARGLFFIGIDIARDAKLHARDGLVLDFFSAGLRYLRNAEGRQILLPPDEASEIGDDIFLERANRGKFRNERAM
jgi:hypothetical protein